jgi:hypothetical protein
MAQAPLDLVWLAALSLRLASGSFKRYCNFVYYTLCTMSFEVSNAMAALFWIFPGTMSSQVSLA